MIPLIPSLYQINTEGKFVMFVYLFAVPRKQALERRESRLTYRIPVVAGSSLIVREHILYGKNGNSYYIDIIQFNFGSQFIGNDLFTFTDVDSHSEPDFNPILVINSWHGNLRLTLCSVKSYVGYNVAIWFAIRIRI